MVRLWTYWIERRSFDKIKEESKRNLSLGKANVKVIAYGANQPSLQIKGVFSVSLVVESKSRITTTDFYVINTEHRNLLIVETAIQLNILSMVKAVPSQWEQMNEI